MKRFYIKRSAAVLGFFLLSLCISTLLLLRMTAAQKQTALEHGSYILESEANKIQYSIDSRLLKLEILEMIIVDNNGTIQNFDKIARQLYKDDPSLRSIQLAPGGIVSYVYPLEGNEDAFGDLFDDPDRREEAEYARDHRITTLAGPFELYQGGFGTVARRPVYLEDASGQEHFWGFCIAVMDVPEIFDKANLEILAKEGYSYKIWRNAPGSEEVQIIAESDGGQLREPIQRSVKVPGGTWTIGLAPKEGWVTKYYLIEKLALSLLIDSLITLTVWGFLLTEHQKQKLNILAHTDALTDLYNERHLSSSLKHLIHMDSPFGLLYLDLNKFKQVNDTYGHDVGDKLLVEVAHRIKSCIREQDLAFRIGGDEFASIILGDHTEDFYDALKNRIEQTVSQPFSDGDIHLIPQISAGYARYPQEQANMEELIKSADQKMYREKQQSEERRTV